jgi:hypothetical protein
MSPVHIQILFTLDGVSIFVCIGIVQIISSSWTYFVDLVRVYCAVTIEGSPDHKSL